MATDLIEVDEQPAHPIARTESHHTDAAQARVDSVAKVIDLAYQRASALELTAEESKLLLTPFPDSAICPGAKGKENLLYLEHASVRARMFEVFGPGRWSLICRRLWTEEQAGGKAVRVYADCVLIVRGCYVGETIGAGNYFRDNAQQDYSDAAEAAQSEALRRICGKYLGIGLNLWNKAWTEAWKARQRAGNGHHREPVHEAAPPSRDDEPYPTIVKNWQDILAAEPTIDAINDLLPDIKAITHAPTRKRVWTIIVDTLKKHDIVFRTELGKFAFDAPNNQTFGAETALEPEHAV